MVTSDGTIHFNEALVKNYDTESKYARRKNLGITFLCPSKISLLWTGITLVLEGVQKLKKKQFEECSVDFLNIWAS